jgi:AAA domain
MPSTFEILSPDGSPIFLAKLPNEKGNGKAPLHQYVRDEAQLQKFLADHDSPGYAIYHTASILKEGAWRNKDNVRATLFVWGEVDFKDHPDLSREEIVRRLDGIPLRPTFSVFSGHGIHLYWLLKEAEDASPGEGQRRIEEVLRLIANYIGGDPHVAETARLMRLPGSHNSRKPGECLPVTLQDVDLSRRYDLTEIEDFLLEACPIMPPPAAKASEVRGKEFDFSQENDWGPVDVEARLAAMRYMGHGPASIHTTQLAVTGSLTRAGKRIEETVARVLARTREVAPATETWNWDKEERDIEDMCKDLINKAMASGDDLSHVLPDELFTAWQRIKQRGLRPNLSRNRGGLFVRATPDRKIDAAPDASASSVPPNEESDESIEGFPNDPPNGGEPKKYRFKLIPFHEMVAGAGDQDYLVDDLIPSKGIVLLWGPPKCLKSFFMYSAMFHVAKGWEFAGRAVQQGPVIYCALRVATATASELMRCAHDLGWLTTSGSRFTL